VVYIITHLFSKVLHVLLPFLLDNRYPKSFYLLYSLWLVIKVQIFLFFYFFTSISYQFCHRDTKNHFSNTYNQYGKFAFKCYAYRFYFGVKSVVSSIAQCNAIVIQLQFIYIYIIYIYNVLYMHGVWGGVYLYSTLKYNIYKIVLTCCRRRCCCSGC